MFAVVIDDRVREVHQDQAVADAGAECYRDWKGVTVEVIQCPDWVYHEYGNGGEVIVNRHPIGVVEFEKQKMEVPAAHSEAMDELFSLLINGGPNDNPKQPR